MLIRRRGLESRAVVLAAGLLAAGALGWAMSGAATATTGAVRSVSAGVFDDDAPLSTISANARATVSVAPDYLDVYLGVERFAATAGEAYRDVSGTMDGVIKALKALDLPGVELQTTNVDLNPRYERRDHGDDRPPVIIAYGGGNTLRVRTTDLNAAARIIDAAIGAGANKVESVSFGVKEVLAVRERALEQAVKAADRKAQVMMRAAGCKRVRLLNVTESSGDVWANRRFANVAAQVVSVEGGGDGGDHASIEPGSIEVSVSVTVAYEVADLALAGEPPRAGRDAGSAP